MESLSLEEWNRDRTTRARSFFHEEISVSGRRGSKKLGIRVGTKRLIRQRRSNNAQKRIARRASEYSPRLPRARGYLETGALLDNNSIPFLRCTIFARCAKDRVQKEKNL